MTKLRNIASGIFLLTLVLIVGSVCAADANLSVSKVVKSSAPFETGQPVTWDVTILNNGPADATNISLAEDLSGFSGQVDMSGTADIGTYDSATRIWNISRLNYTESAHLSIITVFSSSGQQTNNVKVLGLDQTNQGNTHAQAIIPVINNAGAVIPDQPLKVNLQIKPNTLNLNSKGVFTVFITLSEGDSAFPTDLDSKPRIDFGNSSLTCGGAELVRASTSNKDGGTLIAKFHRQDLENVTSGAGVQINCSGTLSVNGQSIDVAGSDTIRVIGEKKGLDKFISGLMKYLGLEKEDIALNETGDGNTTLSVTLNSNDFKNNGQMKKALKTQDTASSGNGKVQNTADTNGGKQKNTEKNTGKDKNTNGKDTSIQNGNAGSNSDNGNKNTDIGSDSSNGKSNGKKNR